MMQIPLPHRCWGSTGSAQGQIPHLWGLSQRPNDPYLHHARQRSRLVLLISYSTLKIGRFDMSNPELVKNIIRGAYRFLPYVLEDIDVSKVRQISIKGYNSPSLPIYNYISPEEVEFFQKYKKIITDKAKAGE